jgi:hypothetical protein
MDHIGGFKRSGADTMNDLINLYRFESFTEYEKARASYQKDAKFLEQAGHLRDLRITEIVKLVEPAGYWEATTLEAALQTRDTPRYYLQAVLQTDSRSIRSSST